MCWGRTEDHAPNGRNGDRWQTEVNVSRGTPQPEVKSTWKKTKCKKNSNVIKTNSKLTNKTKPYKA